MPPPAAERGSATVTLATVAAVLLLLLAVIAGAVGGITGQEASACTAQPAASGAAASIPANYLADFKAAGTRYGIPWTVLAAIGDVESGFGANDGPSFWPSRLSTSPMAARTVHGMPYLVPAALKSAR